MGKDSLQRSNDIVKSKYLCKDNLYNRIVKSFSDLLTANVIKLQQEQGKLIKQKELAELLGVGETSLNLAWNKKRPPSKKLVEICALYFKDMEFYDAVGVERPEPLLSYTRRNWGSVPDAIKERIAKDISKYTEEPLPGDERPKPAKP